MRTKAATQGSTFTVRFETRDGCLIQNRPVDRDWCDMYLTDTEFRNLSLKKDAAQKGVKVVEIKKLDKTGILAIVAWA